VNFTTDTGHSRLHDKVAIVTGTGAGIGKRIAEIFAQEGAKVVAASRRSTNGRPVVDDIVAKGQNAIFVQCDISVEKDVERLFEETLAAYQRVDILVNNAGVNFVKPFAEIQPSDWDRVINTDLRGTFLCTRLAVKDMLKHDGGSIINITSVHTVAGLPGAAPYDAAKCGVVGMTRALAVELAPQNIRVNALSPGLIDTQIWQDIQHAAPNLEACFDFWNSNIPMERVGTAEEIAKVAVFLASDDASYVTGANLIADGGMTSQLISREPYASVSLEGEERD
jgi:NAD(P)-dependent dehydrogenase (short-subunit alcohol dehydrogenase family)